MNTKVKTDKYKDIKSVFNDGDWVIGIDKHTGCSMVFDSDTDNPQPFSYLSETDPAQFRAATLEEIQEAYQRLNLSDGEKEDIRIKHNLNNIR